MLNHDQKIVFDTCISPTVDDELVFEDWILKVCGGVPRKYY